jgi:pyruvate dehydrogenase E1 component subunit alpha
MDNKELIQLYRTMLLIRRFEDRAGFGYAQAKFTGYLHLYIGQEAVGVGFISALRRGDVVVDSYRDHGYYLALGGDPRAAMAELYGKVTGTSGGKGGSMHLYDKERGFYGGTGIVGAGIPIGLGLGYGIKYRGGDEVCLCFFGDGAINTGAFHESLNMAALWKLPIIFICENNLYAMGTAVERSSSEVSLVDRSLGYDVERAQVDGQDLLAVRELAEGAIAAVRQGGKPWFVEALTYRYRGHGAADPGNYRSKEEVDDWRQRDPIGLVEARLRESGALTDADIQRLHAETHAEVDAAIRFAEESPVPSASALYEDIYA